jgi:hypothetical protein
MTTVRELDQAIDDVVKRFRPTIVAGPKTFPLVLVLLVVGFILWLLFDM